MTYIFNDNTTGVLASASATDTVITVTTVTGTWPTPAGGQQFAIGIDEGTDSEEVAVVTNNSAGVFTLVSGLAFNHTDAVVILSINADFLNGITGASNPLVLTSADTTLTATVGAVNSNGAFIDLKDVTNSNTINIGSSVSTPGDNLITLYSPDLGGGGGRIILKTSGTGPPFISIESTIGNPAYFLGGTGGMPASPPPGGNPGFYVDYDGSLWAYNVGGAAWVHVT